MSLSPQLLRLMQLASPALPTGAFAYSQGLEWAVENGLDDSGQAEAWITGIMRTSLARLDIPHLLRLYRAWAVNDEHEVLKWSALLYASRETRELRLEEHQTAGALARLLRDLEIPEAEAWITHPRRTFCAMFSLAGARWDIKPEELCAGYLWTWAENQVAAAIKVIPLGQTAGQKIMSRMAQLIPEMVTLGSALSDDEIGGTAPGQVMASALHETQRTRLFRS